MACSRTSAIRRLVNFYAQRLAAEPEFNERVSLTVAGDAVGGHRGIERELIRERTGEGRKRAMAAGTRFGRKPKLMDHQRREAIARRGSGETLAAIARSYAVSTSR